ncbi:MAG: hypothetical protein Q7S45_01575 [Candidatus Curtissbacteria bacterium]|nr:hypothetical protein [Candidatus Curtissbacteria bacterium]
MTPEHVIVEIGGAGAPIRGIKRDVDTSVMYVSLDQDASGLKKYETTGHEAIGELGFLPLKSDVADEIWLMNVFGEIYIRDRGFLNPYRLRDGRLVFCNSAKNYFHDLAKVLKPQGSIYIGELYSPPDPECLTSRDFAEFGLEKTVYIGADQIEFAKAQHLDAVWGGFLNRTVFGQETFFMRLQKTGSTDSESKKF